MSFPTTGILDSLIVGSSLSANFTTPTFDNGGHSISQTDTVGAKSPTGTSAAYWNAANFGADSEAYITIATKDAGTPANPVQVYCRVTNPGTGTSPNLTGYLHDQRSGTSTLYKVVNDSYTSLGSVSQAITNGDSFGISAVGTTITLWWKAGSGAWTNIKQVTDSAVTGAGRVAFAISLANSVLTQFGGGTVVAAPTNSVAPLVSGSAPVGSTLTTTTGTWTGSPTFTYQWTRDGSNIGGATSSSYVTVTADSGHTVGVTVTGTNVGGSASQASSNTVTPTLASGASIRVLKRRR